MLNDSTTEQTENEVSYQDFLDSLIPKRPYLRALHWMSHWHWADDSMTGGALPLYENNQIVSQDDFEESAQAVEAAFALARRFYAQTPSIVISEHNEATEEMATLERIRESFASRKTWQSGVVYVVKDALGRHKIGLSRNVNQRVKNLIKGETPEIVHLIHSDHIYYAEAYFHDRMHQFRAEGEWFNLGKEQLDWLKTFDRFDFEVAK